MKALNLLRGQVAEQKAQHWLKAQGLTSVAQNYHCRAGEIDLIMLDNEVLVFIEVRQRSNTGYGGAAASVTTQKQHKITLAAQHFLMKHCEYQQHNCRFDVIAFEASHQNPQWYQDAFRLET